MSDITPARRRRSKKFLQEIVEPEIQSEKIELQEINYGSEEVSWDDLNDRQRDEIIQKRRAKDDRSVT